MPLLSGGDHLFCTQRQILKQEDHTGRAQLLSEAMILEWLTIGNGYALTWYSASGMMRPRMAGVAQLEWRRCKDNRAEENKTGFQLLKLSIML